MPPPNAPKPKAAPDNRRGIAGSFRNRRKLPGIVRNAAGGLFGNHRREPPSGSRSHTPQPSDCRPAHGFPGPRRYRKKFFIRSKMFCSLTGAACWNEGEAASFSTSFFSSEVSLSGIVMSTTTSSSPRP